MHILRIVDKIPHITTFSYSAESLLYLFQRKSLIVSTHRILSEIDE